MGFREGAEDDVGECLREQDRAGEGRHGELVRAGLDGAVVGGCEDAVYAEGVEFFLLCGGLGLVDGEEACIARVGVWVCNFAYVYYCSEGINDVTFLQRGDGFGVVAGDIVGDVGEQLGEIGYFEYLVQSQELQRGYSGAL